MAKLRHFAMAVPNTDQTAKFYEQVFGMKRVRESKSAILLSDGVISLAILDNTTSHEALGENGLHHFGVIAEDVGETAAKAESMIASDSATHALMAWNVVVIGVFLLSTMRRTCTRLQGGSTFASG